ncbi:MAG: NAD(+) diphosphatase [Paludibacteraceae bacterium]|nr:NAD(+) diphosphatase [Paludibacteraceae bacterium]
MDYLILCCKDQLVVDKSKSKLSLLSQFKGLSDEKKILVSETDGDRFFVCRCDDYLLSEDQTFSLLRPLYLTMSAKEFQIICMASQLLYWHEHSAFCPACGAETKWLTVHSKICPQCQFELYPTISPAIIVRVTRGNEILLVQGKIFSSDFYGLVAGFVEVGETFEECVCREIKEETDLEVKNIRYWGSQSWPFPSNVMIGFTAEYASGEVHFQKEELKSAGFFAKNNLPNLPGEMSIARKLIDEWLNE